METGTMDGMKEIAYHCQLLPEEKKVFFKWFEKMIKLSIKTDIIT